MSEQLKQTQAELRDVKAELVSRYVLEAEMRHRNRMNEEHNLLQIQSEKVVQSLEARVDAQLTSLARSNTQSLTVSIDELHQYERQLAKQTVELKAVRAELEESLRRSTESQQAAMAMQAELERYKTEKEAEIKALQEQLEQSNKIQTQLDSLTANLENQVPAGNKEAEWEAKLKTYENKLSLAQHENEVLQCSLESQREAYATLETTYRQEFQKHSDDLQSWHALEKSLQLLRLELATAQESLEKKQKELELMKAGESSQRNVGMKRICDMKETEADAKELRERVTTLVQQNEALFKQITEVRIEIVDNCVVNSRRS